MSTRFVIAISFSRPFDIIKAKDDDGDDDDNDDDDDDDVYYDDYSFLGGFYSDDVGYVAISCKKCPNGSFVSYDKAPGTRKQDCKSCPEGE